MKQLVIFLAINILCLSCGQEKKTIEEWEKIFGKVSRK